VIAESSDDDTVCAQQNSVKVSCFLFISSIHCHLYHIQEHMCLCHLHFILEFVANLLCEHEHYMLIGLIKWLDHRWANFVQYHTPFLNELFAQFAARSSPCHRLISI